MSNILTKAFDATKRIARTVFVGAPNLFTSSDLNRQVEAFKCHIDSVENRVGVLSDLSFEDANTYTSDIGINVDFTNVTGTYLEAKGADFSSLISSFPNRVTLRFGHPRWIYIKASQALVTYSDDNTHEIAGALFEDSSSLEAANQLVYSNCTLESTETDPTNNSNCVAVLLRMEAFSDGSYIKDIHFMPKGETLISRVTSLGRIQSVGNGAIKALDSLSVAIEKLLSRFQVSLGEDETSWENMRARTYSSNTWTDAYSGSSSAPKAKLANGHLLLKLGTSNFSIPANSFEFGTGSESSVLKYFIGELPASIVTWLEAHYSATLPTSIFLGAYGSAYVNNLQYSATSDLFLYLERVQGSSSGGYSWVVVARGKMTRYNKASIGSVDVLGENNENLTISSEQTFVDGVTMESVTATWILQLFSSNCCYTVPLLQIFGV